MRDSAEMPARDPPPRLTLPDTAAQDARRRFSRAGAILGRRPALAREAGRSADPEPACLGAFTGVLMPSIPPVQTHYRGVTYRSRTEARWAVFFAALGVDAVYEAEGYDLGGTWYLPDFWVPDWDIFIEVKPPIGITDDEKARCRNLSDLTGKTVLLTAGAPADDYLEFFSPTAAGEPLCFRGGKGKFVICRGCDGIAFEYRTWDGAGWGALLFGRHTNPNRCGEKFGGLPQQRAIEASRNERFGVYPEPA